MSEFKISPVMRHKTRSNSNFLLWFSLVIFAIDMGGTGWMFFRLSQRVESLERQVYCIAAKDGGSNVQR
jgi:hypothetical protein